VLDCGTGSGALLLAFLSERLDASGVGIDRSSASLGIAVDNAARLGIADRAEFRLADWDEPGWADELGRYQTILANPPYVEDHAEISPSVRGHEPEGALFAGADGLTAYHSLIPQLARLLAPGGAAFVEIGATQAQAVASIAQAAGFVASLHHDLANRPRFLELRANA
jgi:release factor glutamine methyltransferase